MKIEYGKWYLGVSWGDWKNIYFFNWLPHKSKCNGYQVRFLGYKNIWYDGPHRSFGFWFFNVTWDF